MSLLLCILVAGGSRGCSGEAVESRYGRFSEGRKARLVNPRLTWWSLANMEGLPHKVNPRLTLWLMPECLASRGCIDEAGRYFSPGLKSHAIGFSRWVTKTLPGLQPLTGSIFRSSRRSGLSLYKVDK